MKEKTRNVVTPFTAHDMIPMRVAAYAERNMAAAYVVVVQDKISASAEARSRVLSSSHGVHVAASHGDDDGSGSWLSTTITRNLVHRTHTQHDIF